MNPRSDEAIEALLRAQFDGPVPDEGFSARVMQVLPPRRRRVDWPLWAGIVAGVVTCWLSLVSAPLLQVGLSTWMGSELTAPVITSLLTVTGMSLLALWWGVAEADEH